MKPRNIFYQIAAATVGGALIMATGCQSGFSKPDLNKLAFWKKDELKLASRADDIPPPSAKFNPDQKDAMKNGSKEQLQASVDAIVAEAKKNRENPQDPIRKPYSLDSIDSKLAGGDSKDKPNDFVLSEKLSRIQTTTNNALATTENAVKQTGAMIENTSNSLAGLKNELQSDGERKIADASNFLKSQADSAISTTGAAVNSLARTTETTIDSTVSSVKNSIDNSFQPRAGSGSSLVTNPYANSKTSNSNNFGETEADESDLAGNLDSSPMVDKPQSSPLSPQSAVHQSSFDSEKDRNSVGLLEPVESGVSEMASRTGVGTPTKYPTTPYGKIRPIGQAGSGTASGALEIPYQLLRGTSTYSPGSTTALQPADSAN